MRCRPGSDRDGYRSAAASKKAPPSEPPPRSAETSGHRETGKQRCYHRSGNGKLNKPPEFRPERKETSPRSPPRLKWQTPPTHFRIPYSPENLVDSRRNG